VSEPDPVETTGIGRDRVPLRPYGGPRGPYIWPRFGSSVCGARTGGATDFFITNLSPEQMPAEAMRDLYRLRWEVELHYRVGRGGLGLDELPSSKQHVVRALVRAALVRASVGMQARLEASKTLAPGLWINTEQWIRLWRQVLGLMAVSLALGRPSRGASTWEALATLAVDPNRRRPPNRHVWEVGQWRASVQ
jgi:hypothetical protein